MGCTPSTVIKNVPQSNVLPTTRSTKSTIKYSDYKPSPQKLPIYWQKSIERERAKRKHSPKPKPSIKVSRQPEEFYGKKPKGIQRHQQPYFKGYSTKQICRTYELPDPNIVSHLSLDSHHATTENLQFLNYQARTPQKNRHQQHETASKNKSSKKNLLQGSAKTCESHRKFALQPSRSSIILESELRNMNTERFERIKISNRNF